MIRRPAVAGSFYPKKEEELISLLSQFFEEAKSSKIFNGLIVPHAGYIYSGKTAAFGFKSMIDFLKEHKEINNIIILGPSHHAYFQGALNDENDEWDTPLGKIKVKNIEGIKSSRMAHMSEHSLEVQVPFIQIAAEKLKRKLAITPLLVGEIDEESAKHYAEILLKQENCFFVISSDLSHYMPLNEAEKTDHKTISEIINLKYEELDACGKMPIAIAIEMAKLKGWKFKLLNYSTSAEASGDDSAVVGYAAIGF